MNSSIVIGLMQNIAILLTFSMLYDYFWSKKENLKNIFFKIGTGIVLGGLGIVLIFTPWDFAPGIIFDSRSILLSIAGLFFGPVPTIIAMAISGAYRWFIGGSGVLMGIAIIFTSGTIGILWRYFRPGWHKTNHLLELAGLGVLVHIVMIGCTYFLPSELIWETLKNTAVPIILVYPVATVLLGALMLNNTENWENRKALIISEKRFRTIIEQATEALFITDLEGNILDTNQQACRNLEYSRDELLKMKITDLDVLNDNDGKVKGTFRKLVTNECLTFDSEHRRKNGSTFPVEINTSIIELDGHQRIIGFVRNISERKQAEEKLSSERMLLRTLIDNLPVTIYVKDAECRKIIANQLDLEFMGAKSEAEVIGKTDYEIFNNEIAQRGYTDDLRVINSGQPVINREEIFWDASGVERWLLTSKIPIHDENGKINGLVGIGRDITEQKLAQEKIQKDISARKQMEAELINAKEKAEESDRLKSAFLANMSHEIRTPLNSIIGFSELLADPDFEQEQKDEFIRTIVENGNSLLVIISDIMDFSMLEARQMKIRNEVISTKSLLNELLADFGEKANQKGIELRLDYSSPNPDVMFENDSYRIKQIFSNLIGNALKFTHEGYIEIGYKIKDEIIEFHVKDTGIGISPEYFHAIFERFRQVDTTKTRKYGGNGLGLAISKNLVELLGGKIWVESEPDKYSEFFFTIPVNKL